MSLDWNEARRLRDSGLTFKEVGHRLGVSDTAVRYACMSDEGRVAFNRRSWETRSPESKSYCRGTCSECGAGVRKKKTKRCAACRSKRAVDRCRCERCGEPRKKPGGPRICRSCQAEAYAIVRPHGRQRYQLGCRCDVCKRANADAVKAYMRGGGDTCSRCGRGIVRNTKTGVCRLCLHGRP